MEPENVLNLLDTYWYDLDFFQRSKPISNNTIPEIPSSNILHNNIPTLPIIQTKSPTKFNDFSPSPNSVLQSPKLQTIFSGKETKEFDDYQCQEQDYSTTTPKVNSCSNSLKGNIGNSSKTRKKKGLSKSLSDLEFEELKGFMDLGFVFSESDKDSTLANIIPGLQRYSNVIVDDKNKFGVSRPYLSEAWEVLESKRKENSMLNNWKVPTSTNQIDMKGYLKSWAHNVASTVK